MDESAIPTQDIPLMTSLGTVRLTIEHFAQQVRVWAGRDGTPPITIDNHPYQVVALLRRLRKRWELERSDTYAHLVGQPSPTVPRIYEAIRAALLPAVTAWTDANPEALWVAVDRDFAADLANLRQRLEREILAYQDRCEALLHEITAVSVLRYTHHRHRPASLD